MVERPAGIYQAQRQDVALSRPEASPGEAVEDVWRYICDAAPPGLMQSGRFVTSSATRAYAMA